MPSIKIIRQYFLPSTCKNSHILYISPDNHQTPLYTSTKTDPCYVIFATNTLYRHTNTRSRQKGAYRICGEDDHTNDKTKKCPNESKCANCEGHMSGCNSCENEMKVRIIKKIQAESRVGRRRAHRIMAGEDEFPRSNPQS